MLSPGRRTFHGCGVGGCLLHSLSPACIVGGDFGGQGLSPGRWLGNAPPSPSLAVVLQASVYTCDLPLHITSANLLLKSRYFSISYLES